MCRLSLGLAGKTGGKIDWTRVTILGHTRTDAFLLTVEYGVGANADNGKRLVWWPS